ncbi:MAG: MGMT family protein [Planctomycetes bacterium]|nr:MGMT family protein [Planctomycetota bacterium]
MKPKKSWREKLAESKDLPKTLLIPAPRQVDELMRRVPRGRVTTINEIRAELARCSGVDTACPLTTGIFAWIAAHAADESAAAGERTTTPYWRTLKSGGELNPKYPGGIARQTRLLRGEGHRVERDGKAFRVVEHERALFAFPVRRSSAVRRSRVASDAGRTNARLGRGARGRA